MSLMGFKLLKAGRVQVCYTEERNLGVLFVSLMLEMSLNYFVLKTETSFSLWFVVLH